MTEDEVIANMQQCQAAADALKVAFVDKKDFEAAARWRDVSLALGRAIGYGTVPRETGGIKVVFDVDGDWIDMPRSSTG